MEARRRPGLSTAQRWTLTVCCLALALVIASMAALYTALPEIAASTGATQAELTWIVDGYTLALACLVLPAGALGDRFGRRRALIAGLLVFSAASALPLVLDSPLWLILARGLAGIGAAFVMPSTLSLITGEFPADRRNSAIGLWAGVASAGAILGILGSGLLVEFLAWQSIFVGLIATGALLTLAAFTLAESSDRERPAFDGIGAVTGALAVGALVVAAMEVPARGWLDPLVIGAALLAVVAGVVFAVAEIRVAHPLLDVRLFADRGFGSGTAILTLQFLVGFGMFLLAVQYFQLVFGFRPLMSAVAMAPLMVPTMGVAIVAPRLADRFGMRWPAAAGLALIGAGLLGLTLVGTDATYVDVLAPLLVMSTGVGLCGSPATAAIVAGTPESKHGVAAAVNDAAREIGAAVGIAVCGSVLAAGYSDRIAAALPLLPEQARGPVADSAAAALEVAERAGPGGERLAAFAREAFVHGMHRAAAVLGILTLVGAAIVAVWSPGRRRPAPVTSAETTDDLDVSATGS